MVVSDAQERGKPEMLFRNHWQRSTPKGFGANEIVSGERVEGEEQGCGQHARVWEEEKRPVRQRVESPGQKEKQERVTKDKGANGFRKNANEQAK